MRRHRRSHIVCHDPIPRAVKLPWIFPGAPLTFDGALRNIQGNLTACLLCTNIHIWEFDFHTHFQGIQPDKAPFMHLDSKKTWNCSSWSVPHNKALSGGNMTIGLSSQYIEFSTKWPPFYRWWHMPRSQHWFSYGFVASAIIWTNVVQDPCHHVVSLWCNGLNHCGLVMPYGDRPSSTLAQVMAWCLQAVDLSSGRSSDIHLMVISQAIP